MLMEPARQANLEAFHAIHCNALLTPTPTHCTRQANLEAFHALSEPEEKENSGEVSGMSSLKKKAKQAGKQQAVLKAIGAAAVARREDRVGYTALMAASEAGRMEAVQLLLGQAVSASPHSHGKEVHVNKPDIYGHTALSKAANGHHHGICELLIEAKADVSAIRMRDIVERASIEHMGAAAHKDKRLDIALLFQRHGGDMNEQDKMGVTPLQYWAASGDVEGLRQLVGIGNVEIDKQDRGETLEGGDSVSLFMLLSNYIVTPSRMRRLFIRLHSNYRVTCVSPWRGGG